MFDINFHTLNNYPSLWREPKGGPQLIYAKTGEDKVDFRSSIHNLGKFEQTLFITTEAEQMNSEDPKKSKPKDLIKFYFKDLKAET